MKKKLDWDLIWEKFDTWCQAEEKKSECGECRRSGYAPDWEDQQLKIQKLVESSLK